MQRRDVKVDDVELVRALRDLLDEEQVQRERIGALRQAQRLRAPARPSVASVRESPLANSVTS